MAVLRERTDTRSGERITVAVPMTMILTDRPPPDKQLSGSGEDDAG